MNIAEQKLLNGINTYTPEAFDEFFRMTYQGLCAYVDRFIKDPALSEDVVQDIFIKFLEKKRTFQSIISVKVFFYRSVRNAAINHLKSKKNLETTSSGALEELLSDDHFTSTVIEQEVITELHNIISTLPSKCNEVMKSSMAGLKNHEIAEELGISINTVKTQKKIAYKIIKESLSKSIGLITVLAQLIIEQ
jgi:RNA polymerase sigma-70 factor (ECF subfamily)